MPRIIDHLLVDYLHAFGAVLIVGPKWCGKTTSAEQASFSSLKLQDPSSSSEYRQIADTNPSFLLSGPVPRLIDEWQTIPFLWDAIRSSVDERGEKGQFILTGSAVPQDDQILHTGTGRIAWLKMYPMSLYESGDSSGNISLYELFNNPKEIKTAQSPLSVQRIASVLCRGGWPDSINTDEHTSALITSNYVNAVCESDVSRVLGGIKYPNMVRAILRAYARNISTLASKSTIHKDVTMNEGSISLPTFQSYLNALERIFVIEDIPAWSPSIRSKTVIRASRKIGFTDPSLAAAALGLSPEYLLHDMNTFGFLFESLVIRDLRVYSQSMEGTLSYYHDRYGLECDVVLHLHDGRYALIEIKLGSKEIEEGASHLLKLKELIQEHHMQEPSLLMIITGGKLAYKRKDDVWVIPLACMKN